MLSAISGSLPASGTATRQSPAVLDAQLAKYQRQLADWKNCPSCKTPEGKARIAAIEAQISDVKSRMKTSESPQTGQQDARRPVTANAALNTNLPTFTSAGSPNGPIGSLVNTYA